MARALHWDASLETAKFIVDSKCDIHNVWGDVSRSVTIKMFRNILAWWLHAHKVVHESGFDPDSLYGASFRVPLYLHTWQMWRDYAVPLIAKLIPLEYAHRVVIKMPPPVLDRPGCWYTWWYIPEGV